MEPVGRVGARTTPLNPNMLVPGANAPAQPMRAPQTRALVGANRRGTRLVMDANGTWTALNEAIAAFEAGTGAVDEFGDPIPWAINGPASQLTPAQRRARIASLKDKLKKLSEKRRIVLKTRSDQFRRLKGLENSLQMARMALHTAHVNGAAPTVIRRLTGEVQQLERALNGHMAAMASSDRELRVIDDAIAEIVAEIELLSY